MAEPKIRFLVFDIESVADGELIADVRYPGQQLDPQQAIGRYRAELLEKYDRDFIPYTFQIPISVVAAKVSEDFQLVDLVTLDAPQYRPSHIAEKFWRGWEVYRKPTLVSFNGRTFDIPLMELAAFRYGLSLPEWFLTQGKSFEQPRNRYNYRAHLDLHDVLTNHGASRFTGGLNLAANMLGKPGKMDVQGDMVQDLYNEGRLEEINDYCRCDVLDTYFVFLRVALLLGWLNLQQEQEALAGAKAWLIERQQSMPVLQTYLQRWGDWSNPWQVDDASGPAVGDSSSNQPDNPAENNK